MNLLDDLAVKYKADKCSKFHNYTKYYDRYFGSNRNNISKVLEIGVCGGSSIKMWRDYFPNATIYGIDILEKCKACESDRIKIFIGNQADNLFLQKTMEDIGAPMDIIIDDGSHISQHQISSFIKLLPFVKSSGFYVVEDITTSYWKNFGGGFKKQGTCIEFFKERIDDIYFSGHKYKGTNALNADLILSDKPNLNSFEKLIESIHFYSGLAFIIRR